MHDITSNMFQTDCILSDLRKGNTEFAHLNIQIIRHRLILSTTNQQAPQPTDVTTN
jgi:hypothetical protein